MPRRKKTALRAVPPLLAKSPSWVRARLIGTREPGDNLNSLLALRRECEASLRQDGHPWPDRRAA